MAEIAKKLDNGNKYEVFGKAIVTINPGETDRCHIRISQGDFPLPIIGDFTIKNCEELSQMFATIAALIKNNADKVR